MGSPRSGNPSIWPRCCTMGCRRAINPSYALRTSNHARRIPRSVRYRDNINPVVLRHVEDNVVPKWARFAFSRRIPDKPARSADSDKPLEAFEKSAGCHWLRQCFFEPPSTASIVWARTSLQQDLRSLCIGNQFWPQAFGKREHWRSQWHPPAHVTPYVVMVILTANSSITSGVDQLVGRDLQYTYVHSL